MKKSLLFISLFLLLTQSIFAQDPPQEIELILSTPQQIAENSTSLIKGLVSPITGNLVLKETDLTAKGAQDITLQRFYTHPPIPYSFHDKKYLKEDWDQFYLFHYLTQKNVGWQFFPHLRLQVNPKTLEIRLANHNGITLEFRLSGSNTTLSSAPIGMSNVSQEVPSGQHDLRNTHISYEEKGTKITVNSPDGSIRLYRYYGNKSLMTTTYYCYLEKEILPNGKVLKYQYKNNQLVHIVSLDPKERFIYATLQIEGTPASGKCQFKSNTGCSATYHFDKKPIQLKVREKGKQGYEQQEIDSHFPPSLASVNSPYYTQETLHYSPRFLLNEYSGKNHLFSCQYRATPSTPYRVHQLLFPVGPSDAFESLCQLTYDSPIPEQKEGATTIQNEDGTKTVYLFTKDLLTKAVQIYDQSGNLKLQKNFTWTKNQWLESVEFLDGQNQLFYKKAYEYDHFGNPISETITGDLTGSGEIESFTINKTYTHDGRNLLLREETEDGKVTSFEYLPNSNLVTIKRIQQGNKLILCECYAYDDCNNLIEKNVEDTSGKKFLTRYGLREEVPFLHMPKTISEIAIKGKKEILIKETSLTYDKYGYVCQEDLYNNQGQIARTIHRTYNERGDVLTETNPLGQTAHYTYDAKGRQITATNFSGRLKTINSYDTQGRLRSEEKQGDDDFALITCYDYDLQDRVIQKTDPFENHTYYTYDPVTSQILKTDFPTSSTASAYDSMGRETSKTDANENTTFFSYNAYGSLSQIHYPDQTKETFLYNKNGTLKSHTDEEGLTTLYVYDTLGRITAKTYTLSNEEVAKETFTYDGFHLLASTDKEGNTTQYSYDSSGRKKRETFHNHITEYAYDTIGRLSKVIKHNDDNTLVTTYKFDQLDRVLEERSADSKGATLYKIGYTYDADGNIQTKTRYIHFTKATETYSYDPHGRLIEYQDTQGITTTLAYDEDDCNPQGQKVLRVKIISPSKAPVAGASTIENDYLNITSIDPSRAYTVKTYTPNGQLAKEETYTLSHQILASKEWEYDPNGNLTLEKNHLYHGTQYQTTQQTHYTYTTRNQIETQTRAFDTPLSRETSYSYTPSNKLASKTLPDGTSLHYTYTPFGHLESLTSSDGKIDHHFTYNRLGHLLKTTDTVEQITIHRKLDPCGNILAETFPANYTIEKTYDAFNRPLIFRLANFGEIHYTYDPLYLRQISRISTLDEPLYTHQYILYDLNGDLLQEKLIGDLGKTEYQYDSHGRQTGLTSTFFSEKTTYDLYGNRIDRAEKKDTWQYNYSVLAQILEERHQKNATHYKYDSLDNRIEKDTHKSLFNALNELESIQDTTYTYDLNGNLISKKSPQETTTYSYDPLSRLIEVQTPAQKIQFTYDPLGRRLSKTTPTYRENYLYDNEHEIGALTEEGAIKSFKILGHLAKPISIELLGNPYAAIVDSQNSVRQLINLAGPIATYSYNAFGEPLDKDILNLPWHFASKRYDPELSLSNFNTRYYDPSLARFLTPDLTAPNPYNIQQFH